MFKTLASNSRIVTYVRVNSKYFIHVGVRVLGFRPSKFMCFNQEKIIINRPINKTY